jgi:hypothetical protein
MQTKGPCPRPSGRTLACAVTALTLAIPAGALAASKTYRGAVVDDPETSLKLRIAKEGGARFFKAFTIRNLAVECEDGVEARLRGARVRGRAPLGDRGRFTTTGEGEDKMLQLGGRVRARRASGTLRLSGSVKVEGVRRECRSGEVRWSATR